jgi:hypothetical protein
VSPIRAPKGFWPFHSSRGPNSRALQCERRIFFFQITDSGISAATDCHLLTRTAEPHCWFQLNPQLVSGKASVSLRRAFLYLAHFFTSVILLLGGQVIHPCQEASYSLAFCGPLPEPLRNLTASLWQQKTTPGPFKAEREPHPTPEQGQVPCAMQSNLLPNKSLPMSESWHWWNAGMHGEIMSYMCCKAIQAFYLNYCSRLCTCSGWICCVQCIYVP